MRTFCSLIYISHSNIFRDIDLNVSQLFVILITILSQNQEIRKSTILSVIPSWRHYLGAFRSSSGFAPDLFWTECGILISDLTPFPLSYLWLTHTHCDAAVGLDAALKKQRHPNAILRRQEKCAENIKDAQSDPSIVKIQRLHNYSSWRMFERMRFVRWKLSHKHERNLDKKGMDTIILFTSFFYTKMKEYDFFCNTD